MADDKWHWQEAGTAWKGVGIYHVTLTVPSREPLLGRLVIPDNDPTKAWVERTELGEAVTEEALRINRYYPEIRVIQHCLMPDHLHIIYYVTKPMTKSIKTVIRGLWQGMKKLGRAYTEGKRPPLISPELNSGEIDGDLENHKLNSGEIDGDVENTELNSSEIDGEVENTELNSGGIDGDVGNTELNSGEINGEKGKTTGDFAFSIFTEIPFIRPLSRRGQLQTMIRYVQMNPQRLATKRLKPGYFRVQREIEIAGRQYSGVGNIALLQAEHFMPVHVRRTMVEAAEHGEQETLRNYMNGCVLAARKGTVMVSPFISPKEKEVLSVLLKEEHPIIMLADNGFGEYYKPSDALFNAVAAGRMLILSPWEHDDKKSHITREECVALNGMAEQICSIGQSPE